MSGTGSSIVDEDTARAVNSGRETVGAMLSTAQEHLRKVFIVFLLGFLGCFYALRGVGWPFLREITTASMSADLAESINIVAVTPFDVILLQAKIGVIAGIIVSLPVLLYYTRDSFRDRSWYPQAPIARWKIASLVLLALGLFVGGVIYGYLIFFPLMFQFLADNALTAGFQTNYSIVKWTEFILFLSLSFGLAAELPLAMSSLGYTGIVPYETFRDKWRYAILGIFLFGALASPPDPFTQIMWAAPLILLYVFSLYLTKFVVTVRRAGERVSVLEVIKGDWIRILGAPVLAFVAVRMLLTSQARNAVNSYLPAAYQLPTVEALVGLPRTQSILAVAAAFAALTFVLAVLYYVFRALDEISGPDPSRVGAPAEIDVENLDAGGVRAAPPEAFEAMGEAEAVDYARQAMDDDEPEKAQAILDRWDEYNPDEDEETDEAAGDEAASAASAAETAETPEGATPADEATAEAGPAEPAEEATFPREPDQSDSPVQSTAAGMANAFTEDETTEDDIGGWYYDIRFILESLTSKMFWLVGIFMTVLAAVFYFLYSGGIGDIWDNFLSRLPPEVVGQETREAVDIVVLHPVEALVFEVKISTLLAAVAILPVVLYWSWPAMKERGIAAGDRRVFGVWGGTIALGLIGGSALGYSLVAPNVISWLVADALRADMIISYRVSNFFWLVFFTTVGIGLLADVPLTMWLFHWGGIVSFDAMKDRWREVTIAVFAVSGLITPDSLYTMFLLAIPISLAYLLGLGVLWAVTLGGRR